MIVMDTEFKGTPGPWAVEEYMDEPRLDTIWHDEVLIAKTCYAPASKYNAKLIASAPDLLMACQELMLSYENNGQLLSFDVDIIRQAINKAVGNA